MVRDLASPNLIFFEIWPRLLQVMDKRFDLLQNAKPSTQQPLTAIAPARILSVDVVNCCPAPDLLSADNVNGLHHISKLIHSFDNPVMSTELTPEPVDQSHTVEDPEALPDAPPKASNRSWRYA